VNAATFLKVDEIIKRVSERLGVSESVAREAIKVLLEFARKRAAGTRLEKLLMEIPGVRSLLAQTSPSGSRGLSGLGSLVGGPVGDAAKAFFDLQSAGLKSDQIGPFVRTFVEKAREVFGPETVEEILTQIPALRAVVKQAK
jgi:hypothetical protein